MSEPEKLPRKIPENLDSTDAVIYRIGEFIETFNEMEVSLAHVLEALIGVRASAIWFMWRDAFTDQKIKTVRRASKLYGSSDESDDGLNAMLNRLAKIAEFRNQLVHSQYLRWRHTGTVQFGKMGQDLERLFEGFADITADDIYVKSSELYDITLELYAASSAIQMTKEKLSKPMI